MSVNTPGPWTAYQIQDLHSAAMLPKWRIQGPCSVIASVGFDPTQTTTAKQDANVRANALLMAEAPDLLRDLKLACEILRAKGEVGVAMSIEEGTIARAEGRG